MGEKMDNEVKKTITVYVPGSSCNLRCEYCYVSQCLDESHIEKASFMYPLEHMIKSFDPKRIGIANITVIGRGETLLPKEVVPFIKGLLSYGHWVEVVTNLTLTYRINELLDVKDKSILKHLLVKGSLHWKELKNKNLVDVYFENMCKVIASGASSYPFLVICKAYMPYLDEIRQVCLEKIHALPQCSPCIVYDGKDDIGRGGIYTTEPVCDEKFVKKIDDLFQSEIFKICIKMLEVDPKKVFCYAGVYGFGVDMRSGYMVKCHNVPANRNFFENIKSDVSLLPVGCDCGISSCALQYNFVAQGFIPEVDDTKYYGEILKKEGCIQPEFLHAVSVKYHENKGVFTKQQERDYIIEGYNHLLEKNSRLEDNNRKLVYNYNKLKSEYDKVAYCRGGKDCDKFNEVLTMLEKGEVKELSEIFSIKYAEELYKACKRSDDRYTTYDNLKRLLLNCFIEGNIAKEKISCLKSMLNIYGEKNV